MLRLARSEQMLARAHGLGTGDRRHPSYVQTHPKEVIMPRGSKSKYTSKQKRKAEHIAESYEERGTSAGEAKKRAWATVNKQSGGGEKSGGGTRKSSSAKKTARKSSARTGAQTKKAGRRVAPTASRKTSSSRKSTTTHKSSTRSRSTSRSTHAKKAAAGRKGGRK